MFDFYFNLQKSNGSTSSQFRWVVNQGKFAFNTASAYDWLTQLKSISLTTDLVDKIDCPVFIASGQNDFGLQNQPKVVAQWLGDRAYYHLFETQYGAGEHCQVGAEAHLAHITLDWLDEIFETGTKSPNETITQRFRQRRRAFAPFPEYKA
jgi:hypothetical protein